MNVPDAVQEKDMASKFVIRTLSLGRRQPCAVTRGPPPPGKCPVPQRGDLAERCPRERSPYMLTSENFESKGVFLWLLTLKDDTSSYSVLQLS